MTETQLTERQQEITPIGKVAQPLGEAGHSGTLQQMNTWSSSAGSS